MGFAPSSGYLVRVRVWVRVRVRVSLSQGSGWLQGVTTRADLGGAILRADVEQRHEAVDQAARLQG